ncbi:hypothetical protein PP707_02450 [Acetobacter pasteurianus]|nr:hypothetical protein [Acetobacter pasteurianus]
MGGAKTVSKLKTSCFNNCRYRLPSIKASKYQSIKASSPAPCQATRHSEKARKLN